MYRLLRLPSHFETSRLYLRPAAKVDLDALHRLWVDPLVRKYLWDDEVIPRDQVAVLLEQSEASFREYGFGLWLAFGREEEVLTGFGGYWFFHEPPELQLIYGITPSAWGQGLATECARALIRYGFDVCGFERILASTDAPNAASIRVLQKAGMTFLKRVEIDGLDTLYYGLDRNAIPPSMSSRPSEASGDTRAQPD